MDGLLLVDKPVGWTSFDVVAKVRSLLRSPQQPKLKVGHSGTLDPLASGLLLLLLGSYTKRAESLTKLDKTYSAVMRLGTTSTTGDEEGEKTKHSTNVPSRSEIETVLGIFTGQIDQIPPVYSAIKLGGQPAYKLARRGLAPELKSRKVTIYSLELVDYKYPDVIFKTSVSSGTYIRSLVTDIGEALKTGAYTAELRRLSIDEYSVDQAVSVEGLSPQIIAQKLIEL